jgi:acetyl esterase/lipase
MLAKTIDIWENYTYNSKREDGFRPTLDTYLLKGDKKRPAVLICPGGGYQYTSEREAEPIALKFNAAGYHAFVCYYSTAPSMHPQPLLDLSRTMCIIRENAEAWKVDSDKIIVCGFSAGGHLVASLGVYWNKAYLEVPGVTPGLNKPNSLILSYPVISSGEYAHRGSFNNLLGVDAPEEALQEMSLEHHVSQITPPTFLWHTFADTAVPVENSLFFAQGLRKNNIPFELHIYPEGQHGLSLATKETAVENMGTFPHVATWIELCTQWLDGINN